MSDGAGWRSYQVDGWEILVGKGAAANDRLTFREAGKWDFWMHASGYAGSHVVVRNPDRAGSLPPQVAEIAAQLAVWHSKAREARGKVEVHQCRVMDVSKPRGFPAGRVQLKQWSGLKVYSRDPFA